MKRHTRSPWVSFLVLTALAGIFPGFPGSNGAAPEPRIPRVTLGIALEPLGALTIVAADKALFEKNGLPATFRYYPSGKLALEALCAGEVDLATVSETPVVFQSFHRRDIRIVATLGTSDDEPRIVARKDSGIRSPQDLRGKRLGTQRGSAVHFFLHLFLLRHRIPYEELTVRFHDPEELLPALIRGDIDAYSMREPYVTRARRELGDAVAVFSEPGLYVKTYCLVTTRAFAAGHPGTLVRALRSLVAAESFAREHPLEARRIVSRRLGAPEPEFDPLWAKLTFRVALEQALLVSMRDEAQWAITNNLTETKVMPNYFDHLYLDGLKAVRPEAVTVIH